MVSSTTLTAFQELEDIYGVFKGNDKEKEEVFRMIEENRYSELANIFHK